MNAVQLTLQFSASPDLRSEPKKVLEKLCVVVSNATSTIISEEGHFASYHAMLHRQYINFVQIHPPEFSEEVASRTISCFIELLESLFLEIYAAGPNGPTSNYPDRFMEKYADPFLLHYAKLGQLQEQLGREAFPGHLQSRIKT